MIQHRGDVVNGVAVAGWWEVRVTEVNSPQITRRRVESPLYFDVDHAFYFVDRNGQKPPVAQFGSGFVPTAINPTKDFNLDAFLVAAIVANDLCDKRFRRLSEIGLARPA